MFDYLSVLILALGMSLDDFALVLSLCLAYLPDSTDKRSIFAIKLVIAFSFSTGLLPLIGWVIGVGFYEWLVMFSAWIVLLVFGGVGLWIIKETLEEEETDFQRKNLDSFWTLVILGILGSLDEGIVGVGYVFLDIPIIVIVLGIISINTILITLAVYLSDSIPQNYHKLAGISSGILLILVGIMKFLEHF
jgi:putative Mn2+ efflux pump MntP